MEARRWSLGALLGAAGRHLASRHVVAGRGWLDCGRSGRPRAAARASVGADHALLMVYVTYLGVVVIGYPEGAPPFRMSSNEFRNLFGRWDAGWYIGIAESGYNYWGNLSQAVQRRVLSRRIRSPCGRVPRCSARAGDHPNRPRTRSRPSRSGGTSACCTLGGWCRSLSFTWALVYLFRLARDMTDSEEAADRRRRPGGHVSLLVLLRRGLHRRPVPALRDGRGLPLPAARVGAGRARRVGGGVDRGPTGAC